MDNNRIHSLPLHLANQIAAGEVIERPASVVKELIENSIDAQATQIDINIDGAGIQLIRIQDNGIGIHADDLVIALSRHATSKIHSSEQLNQIASLGFRGEALPSIASISRLTLTSRQADTDCGYKISENEEQATPAAHPCGTSFEIRDLFFNLPARRRFLRSNKTEQHHILTTIQRLALSQFNIGFSYSVSGVNKLKLAPATTFEQRQQRIAKICGNAFINTSYYIEQHYDDMTLTGWLGKAEMHRAQTDVQYFFINGRVIRDRVINHAIRQAYNEHIPQGRQAAYVLYLTIPLDRVDINVHPTKHEVRFRNARLIHGLIIAAIQDALATEHAQAVIMPTQPEHVAEQISPHYAPSPIINSASNKRDNNKPLGQALTLLERRYLISQTTQSLLLIDLQFAQYQLHCQQLEDAIANNNLCCRPILVPISITANRAQTQAIEQQLEQLEKLAIKLQLKENNIIVRSIPSLLAHSDITSLMSAIINVLTNESTSSQLLIEVLRQHIPLLTIDNIEQAKQLLEQLNEHHITEKWCIPLDQQTLSSLF